MIAAQENCLDREALRDLLAGRLPEDRFALAWEHVETCPKCTATLEDSHSGAERDSFPWLRQAAVLDCVDAEPEPRFDHEIQYQALLGDLLVNNAAPEVCTNSADAQGWDRVPKESLGPYRLIKAIGSGGMGAVYLAEHQRLKRQVAIKLLPREKLLRSGWLDRFNREMTSIAALEHTNVVRALDAGDEDGWHYLVMEHLEGLDLSQICRRVPDVSVGAACELIRQAALGLAAIHAVGMVHRDVKPSNIFLTRGGTVKLLDLGLVLSGESPLSADERLTTVGHLMGTLPYMAREQLNDARKVDQRTDLYSLGATLYRILTGKPPYGSAENLAHTISQISTLDCPSIAKNRADFPEELVAIVTKLLSHDPEQRPQSAHQVAESLAPFADPIAVRELLRIAQNTTPLDCSMVSAQRSIDISLEKQPPRRWSLWIAMGLLFPLIFGAGIFVTITTDQGILTIQSDLPGIEVVVKQGEKAVKTLRVEQQSESVVLRSGRYIIELTGVASDELEISDRNVAIMRGDQQLVHVSQRVTGAPQASHSSTSMSSMPSSSSAEMGLAEPFQDISDSSVLRKALSFLPLQPDVDYEAALSKDWRSYSLVALEDPAGSGFEVKNSLGQRMRWFADTNDDSKLDTWIYYKYGIEVYREYDSDSDGNADTFTWADGRTVRSELPKKDKLNEKLFQNQPLTHWMQVLVRDQDSQTLGQAMQAVVLLAETDAQKLAAARQLLIPSRKLGGLVSTGGGPRPEDPSPSDLSHWFMTDLMRWYPNFFPKAGAKAIEEELGNPNGTEAGWMACMLLLHAFRAEYEAIGTPILAHSYYGELMQSDEGRQRMESLQESLKSRSEEFLASAQVLPEGSRRRQHLRSAAGMGIMLRLVILKLLDGVPDSDPQIDDWAKRQLEEASVAISLLIEPQGQMMGHSSPRPLLRATTALDIYAAVGVPAEYVTPLVFGLLSPNDEIEAQKALQVFDSVGEQHPEQTVQAVGKFLQFQEGIQRSSMMFSGHLQNAVNKERLPFWRTEPIRHATNFFAARHSDPIVALQLFGNFAKSQESKQTEPDFDISIIDKLLTRVILETPLDADSQADAKFAYASYAYNELQRWIDDDRRVSEAHQQARLRLLQESASRGRNNSYGITRTPSANEPLDLANVAAMAGVDPQQWNDGTFFANLNQLSRQYPSLWFPAIAEQMLKSDVSTEEFSLHLLPELLVDMAWSSHNRDSELTNYFGLPTSRPSLLSMRDSLEQMLASQSIATEESRYPLLQSALQSYVAILRLLGESIHEKQTVLALLRSLVALASERPDEHRMPLDLLIALSQTTSPAEIPLPAVWSASSGSWQEANIDVELKREFVRSLLTADRAAFKTHFLNQLQAVVDRADVGVLDSFLANNSISPDSLWCIIIESLRYESDSRTKTETIIREMLKHFDEREESLSDHRRQELKSLLAPR